LLAFVLSCTPAARRAVIDLDEALAAAAASPIAIEGRHRGSRLLFAGEIVRLGYMTRTEIETTSQSGGSASAAYGVTMASGSAVTVQRERELRFAYVALAAKNPSAGTLVCLFDANDDRQAARLLRGQRVRVSGYMKKVTSAEGDSGEPPVIMLNRCDVE
jgi:hypothetical protein